MATTVVDSATVFIAEDNPILLQGLERALTANGYAVQTATDGVEMLELVAESELPDVLLVDVMMPQMNGIDLLEALRSNPRTSGLPVVLITAAADQLPMARLNEQGVDVLMKPFRLADLLSRLERHVGPASIADDPVALPHG